jgi:hypothetical protein
MSYNEYVPCIYERRTQDASTIDIYFHDIFFIGEILSYVAILLTPILLSLQFILFDKEGEQECIHDCEIMFT